jgi:hypothetical protein
MGDLKVDGDSSLRGNSLDGSERKSAVDHTAFDKSRNTDTTLRIDDEEDTLYEDGLEIEDDSSALTGINGRDDTSK